MNKDLIDLDQAYVVANHRVYLGDYLYTVVSAKPRKGYYYRQAAAYRVVEKVSGKGAKLQMELSGPPRRGKYILNQDVEDLIKKGKERDPQYQHIVASVSGNTRVEPMFDVVARALL